MNYVVWHWYQGKFQSRSYVSALLSHHFSKESHYQVRIKEGRWVKNGLQLPTRMFPVLSTALWATRGPHNLCAINHQGPAWTFVQRSPSLPRQHFDLHRKHGRTCETSGTKPCATQLYAKLSKCEFHKKKTDYLGYHISHEGFEIDPEKVHAVLECTQKQLQNFLGLWTFTSNLSHHLPK